VRGGWFGGGVAAVAVVSALSVLGAVVSATAPAGAPAAAPAAASVRVEASAPHMGTLARVVVYAPTQAGGEAAAAAAFARIAEIDARLSDYRDDSEVAALSRAAVGVPRPISPDLFAVLAASQALAARTDGAFDITAGRLTHLWRRARRLNAWPDAATVDAARAVGGFRHVRLDAEHRTVTLDAAGLEIDAGGIGKGYAAEEGLRVLRDRGLPAALVALAGDIAAGDPPPGQPGWTVAIPRLGGGEPFGIRLAHAAVSTSGDAEQWMTVDGVRRSHVIDPRTGWPTTGRSSTSVVAARGIDADPLSTTLGIVERTAGEALLRDVQAGPVRSGPVQSGPVQAGAGEALWQRLRDDGTLELHQTSRWPATPLPAAVTMTRGIP
jgi:thiamine biosynthesis lipoprotein